MKPVKIDITIYQGSTFRKRFWFGEKTDPAGPPPDPTAVPPVNFTPEDLTGCTARMQVRQKIEDTTTLLDFVEADFTIGDEEGWIEVLATDERTEAFDFEPDPSIPNRVAGLGVYDLKLTYANGEAYRRVYGNVVLDAAVTREAPVA